VVKKINLHLCPKVVLFFTKQISRIFLLKLVEKTKQLYVLLALANNYSIKSFDLWTSKGFKVFALVINLLGADWSPKHIAIVFFEAFDTFGHALAKDLIELLGKYDFFFKSLFILKMKDLIDVLGLTKSFQGSCFGHAFFKAS
jgi:hypothetical protein